MFKGVLNVCNMIEMGEVDKAMQVEGVSVEYQMTHGHVRPVDKYHVKVHGTNDVFHVTDSTQTLL